MRLEEIQTRRLAAARARREHVRRRRVIALSAVVLAIAAVVLVVTSSGGSTGAPKSTRSAKRVAHSAGRTQSVSGSASGSTVTGRPTGQLGTTPVPLLMYHVIAPPPPGAPFPGLYVTQAEFAAQMQALKTAGWHAVTLDQLEAYWTHGVPLPPGKPIVLTFDNGYRSQYVNALPILQRLGWVGNENLQLSGLPPSQGGLTDDQVRGMIKAGWELDTQGISHADLITLNSTQLNYQIASARQMLRRRYGVPVNWFCYPSGHYNAAVIAAVKTAGFVGSTTVVPGWASPSSDPFRLPRLRILAGTSPQSLLSQIASTQQAAPPPSGYSGA